MSLHFLGRALLSLGRLDGAETAFKRRLALAPHSDMTRFYLACLHASRGHHDEARRYWDEMLAVNPRFSVDHLKRALPYRSEEHTSELQSLMRIPLAVSCLKKNKTEQNK